MIVRIILQLIQIDFFVQIILYIITHSSRFINYRIHWMHVDVGKAANYGIYLN